MDSSTDLEETLSIEIVGSRAIINTLTFNYYMFHLKDKYDKVFEWL